MLLMPARIQTTPYADSSARPSRVCPNRRVQTALDKRALMQRLQGEVAGRGCSVFVGDSITDLGAMLAADIGIVMGDNDALRRVAAAAGIAIEPLVTGVLQHSGALRPLPACLPPPGLLKVWTPKWVLWRAGQSPV